MSTSRTPTPKDSSQPILTLGVIADIQYAPIPDGRSFDGAPRYYRHALEATKHAAIDFENQGVHALINLGDTIDAKCQFIDENGGSSAGFLIAKGEDANVDNIDNNQYDGNPSNPSIKALDLVSRAISNYKSGPIFHTYGNHDLYNFSHKTIGRKLKIPFVRECTGDLVGYYSSAIPSSSCSTTTANRKSRRKSRKLRIVVLDSYDVTLLQRVPPSRKHALACQILSNHNPNYPHNVNSPEGLADTERRFVGFNGGIDKPQLTWLRETLELAREEKETVVVITHQPILPESAKPICLIWNYSEVLQILREFGGVVAAVFAGHDHAGGYKRDEDSGIHFRVFEAMLESAKPLTTYGFVDVYWDRLVVRGVGDCK